MRMGPYPSGRYIAELRMIPAEKLRIVDRNEPVDSEYRGCFMSLIGGLAWILQKRMDVAVHVWALQRRLQNPTAGDLWNCIRIAMYVKQKPLRMIFRKLTQPWKLIAISDSGFRGEDQDHLAGRSGIICLVDRSFKWLADNRVCKSKANPNL